jgi:hypothetical protein
MKQFLIDIISSKKRAVLQMENKQVHSVYQRQLMMKSDNRVNGDPGNQFRVRTYTSEYATQNVLYKQL